MSEPRDEETQEHEAEMPSAPAAAEDTEMSASSPPERPPELAQSESESVAPSSAPAFDASPPEPAEAALPTAEPAWPAPAPAVDAAPPAPAAEPAWPAPDSAATAPPVDDSPTTEHLVPPMAPAAPAQQPSQGWQQPPPQQPPGPWQQPAQPPQSQPQGQWQQPPQQGWQGAPQYPAQPGWAPQQGYPAQPGYPQQPDYPQPGYPPEGYPQQQYAAGPAYSTSAIVAVAALLLAVFGLVDVVGGVWLLSQGAELRTFIQQTSINLFGTNIDKETMRSLLSPLPGVLAVWGALEIVLGVGIFAHKRSARALAILLSVLGLLIGVASVSFALALAPGLSVALIGALVILLGYAFIILALIAGGGHFRRRSPQR